MGYPIFFDKWFGPYHLLYADYIETTKAVESCAVISYSCRVNLICVLDTIPNHVATYYAAAATVLGLVSTIDDPYICYAPLCFIQLLTS